MSKKQDQSICSFASFFSPFAVTGSSGLSRASARKLFNHNELELSTDASNINSRGCDDDDRSFGIVESSTHKSQIKFTSRAIFTGKFLVVESLEICCSEEKVERVDVRRGERKSGTKSAS
jgi:ribosomal protein L23